MKKIYKVIFIIVIALVIIIGALAFYIKDRLEPPMTGIEEVITIDEAESTRSVFRELEDVGIIKDSDIAYYYARFFLDTDLMAGDYLLSSDNTIDEIVNYITDPSNAIQNTVMITFPEGDWLKDMASRLEESLGVDAEGLLAYWNDEEVVRSYMSEYPFLTEDIFNNDTRYLLEGYLFPETYEFYRDSDFDTITRRFLDATLTFYEDHLSSFEASELSIHEVFTLASIVQYEAAKLEDMRLIAGVFINRLAMDMPLQSSVTVCYAMDIDRNEDDWRSCEYNPDYDSPYNTYMYYGLTPGPILNPGADALEAVLDPEESDYLYFMADVCGDGTVYYAKEYDEHQANVDRYLDCY